MLYFLAIILGLIQALTEFLPISSSAHLILARAWLDFDIADGLAFDVALHVGTLIAVILYFREDLMRVARGVLGIGVKPGDPSRRLGWLIVVGCIPAAVAGVLFENIIEVYFRHPAVTVATLPLGAILFLAVERVAQQNRRFDDMTLGSALFIGVAQTLALIPGVSRSGITIASGMMKGFTREEAARFSFLMAVPLLAGAGAMKGLDLVSQGVSGDEMGLFAVGLLTSALAGWFVIKALIAMLRRFSLAIFAWYRIILAAIVAIYLWM